MNKQTFSQFVQSLDEFLTWIDDNTIMVNNDRYWKDSDDYISNPLCYDEIISTYANRNNNQ